MKRRRIILSNILKNNKITLFQKKVYRTVLDIPSGQVRSYSWVAARIGVPGSARAVGNALNRNPYPVSVPCHRVVKSDGKIGGYYKGRRVKEELLRREGVDCVCGRVIIFKKQRELYDRGV